MNLLRKINFEREDSVGLVQYKEQQQLNTYWCRHREMRRFKGRLIAYLFLLN